MKKTNKIHITFHNPNTNEELAKFLIKFLAEISAEIYINDFQEGYDSSKTIN